MGFQILKIHRWQQPAFQQSERKCTSVGDPQSQSLTTGSLFSLSQPTTCYHHSHCTNIRPETLKKINKKKKIEQLSSLPLCNSEDLKCNDPQWFKLHCEPLWCVLAKLTREITRGAQTIQDWKTPTVFLFPVMINIISYWFKWEGL